MPPLRSRVESFLDPNFSLADQKEAVFDLIQKENFFSPSVVQAEVEHFYGYLQMPPKYFSQYSPADVAKHISILISAKRVAEFSDGPIRFGVQSEREAHFLCASNFKKETSLKPTVDKVLRFLGLQIEAGRLYSVVFMNSKGPLVAGSQETLASFTVKTNEHATAFKFGEAQEFDEMASTSFLETKSSAAIKDYKKITDFLITKQRNYINFTDESVFFEPENAEPTGRLVLQFASYDWYRSYLGFLLDVLVQHKLDVSRIYVETFSCGIVTYNVHFDCSLPKETQESLLDALKYGCHFRATPNRSDRIWDLVRSELMAPKVCIYVLALVKFAYHFFPKKLGTLREMGTNYRLFSEESYYEVLAGCPALCVKLFQDFEQICKYGKPPVRNQEIANMVDALTDVHARKVMSFTQKFNEAIRITNFFRTECVNAMAYMFDPQLILQDHNLPEIPYAIYLVAGRGFHGFHIRYREISRGGIRIITSASRPAYENNCASLFEENLNLAYTQHRKNKDIPEGGAKGTILMDSKWATPEVQCETGRRICFLRYIDALLDCMVPDQCGINHCHLKHPEILFFGPDENSADYMDMGALRAQYRGYPHWKSMTTGKSVRFGGIPHDKYGMTTRGVHQFVVGVLKDHMVSERLLTKFQTGGPDGDLGSNEILISEDNTIGIVDGSGVAYAPEGLNREELKRLALARLPIANFKKELLPNDGFMIPVEQGNLKLPDGSLWRSGLELRNSFHLTGYAKADLFVPCGGRPNAVNKGNIHQLMDSRGCPKFRFIVEGANLFFTDEAREILEKKGVKVFKDASTNKGGVISSSIEVFASLALPADRHQEYFCINEDGEIPKTYQELVNEVLGNITTNAQLEYRALAKNKTKSNTALTGVLSDKINRMADSIREKIDPSSKLAVSVLAKAVPAVILKCCGSVEGLVEHTPPAYIRSVCASYIASRFVYQRGFSDNEYDFFEYMHSFEA